MCIFKQTGDGDAMNKKVDEEIDRQKAKLENEVRLLLLGTAESGKSTLIKQMKCIHEGGFSVSERKAFTQSIYSNIIDSIQKIIAYLNDSMHDELFKNLRSLDQAEFTHNPSSYLDKLILFSEESRVKSILENTPGELSLMDSASYLLLNIKRICSDGYIPTNEDIIWCRVKTVGISEYMFKINSHRYRMCDVGGQRSKRMQWRSCFSDVTAVIFMVAISEYDQRLDEDSNVNRMRESLSLFSSLINQKPFTNTSIILFFNKIDIFEKKIIKSPIEAHFPDYDGGPFVKNGYVYFKNLFLNVDKSGKPRIYVDFTCATDTEQIKFVMGSVNDIFLKGKLREANLL